MGTITDTANTVWRDYDEMDIPSSGFHKPVKPEIRDLFALIDSVAAGTNVGSVASRAELALAPQAGGYFLMEAGREGHFRWTAGDLSAWVTVDPQQGIYVAPTSDITGHAGAFVRVRGEKFVNIEWFGAKEWASLAAPGFDSTLFIKAAVDLACNEGGKCYVPPKIFQIRDTIRNWGCEIYGEVSQHDFMPTANRVGNAWGSRLIWPDLGVIDPAVSATKMMLLCESKDDTLVETPPGSGTFLRTPLVQPINHDIVLDCNAQAGYGFYQSTALRPKAYNMYLERATVAHFAALPRNGNLVGMQWDNIVMNSRLRPPCINAHGLVIGATATGYPTGGHGGYASASGNLDGTGWAFKVGNIDTLSISKIEGFGFKSNYYHQGNLIYFFDDVAFGNGPCRKVRIVSFGGGIFKTDPEVFGIELGGGNSEGFQLDLHPNSQVVIGTVADAVTGDKHRTLDYFLDDEVTVPLKDAVLTGAVASTLGALGVPGISFADAATDKAVWIMPDRPNWNHGAICSVWVTYGTSVADPAKNFRLEVEVRCPRTDGTTDLDNTIEFQGSEIFTLPAPTVADKLLSYLCHFALPVDFKRRCAVALRVQRLGLDTLDDSTQALKIACLKLMFKGDGPNENQGEGQHQEHGRWESGQRLKQDDEFDVARVEGTFVYNDYVGGKQPTIITSYEAETNALIAAFTVKPWQWQIYQINDTIKLLKNTSSLWTKCDFLYVLSSPEEDNNVSNIHPQHALINWKNPGTNTLTKSGQPDYSRNLGYRGGSGVSLNIGMNWNALTLFQQNSAHAGMVCINETVNDIANASMIGSATTQQITLVPKVSAGTITTRLNTAAAAAATANPRSRGHLMLNRTGAAGYDVWTRGTKLANVVAASAAVIAEPMVLLRGTNGNNTHRMAAFHCGQGLTDTECAQIAQIIAYHCGHCRG